MNQPTYLYLISPPRIEDVEAFAKELRAAFEAGRDDVEKKKGEDSSPTSLVGEAVSSIATASRPEQGRNNTQLIGAFQLRLKDDALDQSAPKEEVRTAVEVLLPICREFEVAFILNDLPELAAELGCDGVHLGQEDLERYSIAQCRELLGNDAILGVSCHDSKHLAMDAAAGGADYVAFGAFYPTQSKQKEKLERYGTPTVDLLAWWSTYTEIPCVAIGGMTPENCAPMVQAGADFIAAITSVWQYDEGAAAAVKAFGAAFEAATTEAQ